MGIPSYFSYIVRNYTHIIRKLNTYNLHVDRFYLDSNSIIYDVIKNHTTQPTVNSIITDVIVKIGEYIKVISPKKLVYIAFDGVAPIAKLEQQRQRRYKSWYQCKMMRNIKNGTTTTAISSIPEIAEWNTCQITPGTPFMDELNNRIKCHFEDPAIISLFQVENIIVSTSQEKGEGEHKIFHYIRQLSTDINKEDTHIVYGLDADLIMLSINHLPISPKIYLFRETPEFIKSIQQDLEPGETYLMDIHELANIITLNMSEGVPIHVNVNRIYDYIFLCFFLGNDFMPHFPSLNIRTGGIDKLLNAYRSTIGQKNKILTDGHIIYWENVLLLLEWLSHNEEKFFIDEVKLRDRKERNGRNIPEDTPENKWRKIDNIPTYERELEKYIQPNIDGWKRRYYRSLFQMKSKNMEEEIPIVVLNYLEGLEWTMRYYTEDCVDWTWKYKYSYPPLLSDLFKYGGKSIPKICFKENTTAVAELVQLCYVVPRSGLDFLPIKLKNYLGQHYELYPENCEFIWAFCRYFWEAHAELPDLSISFIEDAIFKCSK